MVINITGSLVIDEHVRDWCRLPYPNHINGCPNWNKKDICPPTAPMVDETFDLSKEHWFAIVKFNLKEFADKLKEKHPCWSDRQCRCCLYWQGKARKQLSRVIKEFIEYRSLIYTLVPEAMGVNVFRTLHKHRIMIRKNPEEYVYKVALIGNKL